MSNELTVVMPRVRVKDGWCEAGKEGTRLGPDVLVGQWWTPVKWDDDEDPDFFKTAGLMEAGNMRVDAKWKTP